MKDEDNRQNGRWAGLAGQDKARDERSPVPKENGSRNMETWTRGPQGPPNGRVLTICPDPCCLHEQSWGRSCRGNFRAYLATAEFIGRSDNAQVPHQDLSCVPPLPLVLCGKASSASVPRVLQQELQCSKWVLRACCDVAPRSQGREETGHEVLSVTVIELLEAVL